MTAHNHRIKKIILFLGDVLLLYGALFATLYIRQYFQTDRILVERHIIPFTIIFAFWLIFFGAFGLYDLRLMKNSKIFLYRLLKAIAASIVLTILFLYVLPFFEIEPRRNLFLLAIFATVLIFLWRYLFNLLIVRAPASRVIFVGVNKETVDLVDFLLKNPQLGQRPVAFIAANGEEPSSSLPLPLYTLQQDLAHVVRDLGADVIAISSELKENKTLVKVLFQVIPLGISVTEFPKLHEMHTGKIPLSLIQEVWFLENLVGIKKRFYEFFKRGLDMVVAVLLGIPTSFLLPLIALAIKLDSKGPIFYRQKRVGRNGREFGVFKYRSMVKDADKMSGFKEGGLDTRHTRVGKFLRKSYIDELPQIINIFKGEMSFVGPRPERPEYVRELKQKIPFYEMRLLVPPGITGWAQIHMENDASVEDAPEKMQYDLYYVKHRSFVLDLLIILRTIFIILRREGR